MGKHRYGVILDAGSSGSRVYVYQWLTPEAARAKGDEKKLNRLPRLKTDKTWRKKVKPGISTFGSTPQLVGPDHMRELVEFALDIVPADEVAQTPIFLLATAGMRLLPEYQRKDVLASVCAYFQENTTFQLPDCALHVQVIPGETEGLYGWIAANYLLGGFDSPEKHDHGKGHNTYGFLDMGGASAQIAFAPNATEAKTHADDLKLLRLRKVNGDPLEYKVFVTTWLGFGANEARRRYLDVLLESYPSSVEKPDPCLPAGLTLDLEGHEVSPKPGTTVGYLNGTGDFTGCLKATIPLLEKDKHCVDEPCLLNGVHTPAIDFGVNHFVGVSEYWHTTHEVFAMAHKDRAYDFPTYQKQVAELCSRKWVDIEKDMENHKWGKKVAEKKQTLEEVCFKASWLISMLHDGIGIPRKGIEDTKQDDTNKTEDMIEKAKDRGFLDPFQAVDKIDGTEVSWTLGKMVLYASSQMPAADEALAVGFGSNVPGSTKLPLDFQFAGGKYEPSPLSPHDDDDDWHDRILSSSYSRRAPGIVIFLLILVLAGYLLCGRDRRIALTHKFLSLVGRRPSSPKFKRNRRPGFLNNKLFGNDASYDRVLEEADPDDFELSDIEGPYSDGNSADPATAVRNGRSSGWATPATRGLSPDVAKMSPRSKSYLDMSAHAAAGSSSSGSGITPFERGGLTVRTESKERLVPKRSASKDALGIGQSSRSGSPVRRSPLLAPFKESME